MLPLRGLDEDLALIGAFHPLHGYLSNISKVIRVTKEWSLPGTGVSRSKRGGGGGLGPKSKGGLREV